MVSENFKQHGIKSVKAFKSVSGSISLNVVFKDDLNKLYTYIQVR